VLLLVTAPVLAAIGLHGHHGSSVVTADVLAGTGVAVLLGLLLGQDSPQSRPAEPPGSRS
jgi:hypothetical protein